MIKYESGTIANSIESEKFVEQIFKDSGFSIQNYTNAVTSMADFIVEKKSIRYAIEVKRGFISSIKIREICDKLSVFQFDEKLNTILVYFGIIDKEVKKKIKKDYRIDILDISNLLYLVSNNCKMKNKLMSLINFSIENIKEEPFVPNFGLNKYDKDYEYDYVEKLNAIKEGKRDATKYEILCVDILKYLFNDRLSLWKVQEKSNANLYRFDLICKIKNGIESELFNTIEKYFLSKYIIFEFKNYDNLITQREIYTTEKYLYKTALRTIAIILTRKGVDNNGLVAIKGSLRENGKLIIVLDDEDIKQMIKAKEKDEDFEEIIVEKLDSLLIELEK